MENGIKITRNQDGIVVDETYCLVYGDAEDIVSKYFFSNFWEEFTSNPSDGEISPNSLFIKFACYAPLPCASGFTIFSYCNSSKFVAGYLKFIVSCSLIRCTLVDLPNKVNFINEDKLSFDADWFLENYKTDDSDRKDICVKIKHILRLCNLVFLEQNENKAKKLLFSALDKFNEYFSDTLDWTFEVKAYDGAKNAKDEILSFLDPEEEKAQVSAILSKSNWSERDKIFLSETVESIVG